MKTLIPRVTVFYNETRGSRFERYVPTATMVASRYYVSRPLLFEVEDAEVDGRDGPATDSLIADLVFRYGNRDDRPNGAYERSISVGDVIVIHGSSHRYPDAAMAVDAYGMRRLGRAEWPPRP